MRDFITIIESAHRLDLSQFGSFGSGPEIYLHLTHSAEDARSIVEHGFDLRRFGASAKRFNMPELARFDPKGVYATDAGDVDLSRLSRPYVTFRLDGEPRVLCSDDGGMKQALAQAYGARGAALTGKLRAAGIDVLNAGLEFVILDPSMIRITGSSESNS